MVVSIQMPVQAWLDGGSVMVSIGEPEDNEGNEVGFKLTALVQELVEGVEVGGRIDQEQAAYLEQVQHEMALAANLLRARLRAERAVEAAGAS